MKKFLIFALLLMALSLAFFGCGHSDGWYPEPEKPKVDFSDFQETVFELPGTASAPTATTGEKNSDLYKFTGDDFTKIKDAIPGSQLAVTYKATVDYAVGEIGWIDGSNAGPVIIADGSNKKQVAYIDIGFLVLGDDSFTIHIFNGATLLDVTLMSAPDGYEVVPDPKATAGATPIFIPSGHKVPGNGDLSKADFKKITSAASGNVVFYFNDDVDLSIGLMKFGPKCGDPYRHYGMSAEGTHIDGDEGWRPVDGVDNTIKYSVAELKTALTALGSKYNKFEINMGSTKRGDLLYIELVP